MHRLGAKAAPCAAQTRAVGSECFLEACVENGAKAPLALDYVRFDPTPGLLAAPVVRRSSPAEAPDQEPLDEYVQSLQVVLLPCLIMLCQDARALKDKSVLRFVACQGVNINQTLGLSEKPLHATLKLCSGAGARRS